MVPVKEAELERTEGCLGGHREKTKKERKQSHYILFQGTKDAFLCTHIHFRVDANWVERSPFPHHPIVSYSLSDLHTGFLEVAQAPGPHKTTAGCRLHTGLLNLQPTGYKSKAPRILLGVESLVVVTGSL